MDCAKFLQSLIDAKNKFLADCNTALKPLPPVEQHEASSTVGYAIREMNSALQWITNTCLQLDVQLKDYVERANQMIADANKAFVASEIEKGELIPKARLEAGDYLTKEVAAQTAQAAAEKAANERETEVVSRLQLLASRRAELYTPTVKEGKEVPALLSREMVEKLPDELLRGDDYLAKAGIIASRLGEVQALGVNVPRLLARAQELPLDEAGAAQFQDQLSMIKAAVDESKGTRTGANATVTAPFAMRPNNEATELEAVF